MPDSVRARGRDHPARLDPDNRDRRGRCSISASLILTLMTVLPATGRLASAYDTATDVNLIMRRICEAKLGCAFGPRASHEGEIIVLRQQVLAEAQVVSATSITEHRSADLGVAVPLFPTVSRPGTRPTCYGDCCLPGLRRAPGSYRPTSAAAQEPVDPAFSSNSSSTRSLYSAGQ
jgi:hypothetical protein